MANFDFSIRLKALTQEYLAKIKSAKQETIDQFNKMRGGAKGAGTEIKDELDKGGKAADGFSASIERATSKIKLMVAGFVSFVGIKKVFEGVLGTGDKFERLADQLEGVMGSLEGGQQAMAWIEKFTSETPYQLEQVTQGFVKLKAFGIDPMDGTYQAIVDQTAKLGGSQETLNGIILAVGQAWAKQKLQGEEILQLVERGVPVWDLLTEATGKNVQELQKLSEQGKLGRTEIKLLIDEIGKSADGQTAKAMNKLSGYWSNLKDLVTGFMNEVSEAGALEYFKGQLRDLIGTIKEMQSTGELQQYAKSISNTMIQIGQAIKGTIQFLFDYADAIKVAAGAMVALKAGQAIKGLFAFKAIVEGTTGSVRTFTKLMLAGGKSGGFKGFAEGAIRAGKATALLSRALIATGWGAAAAGIGFVIVKLLELKNLTDSNKRNQEALKKQTQEVADVYAELSKRIGITIQNSKQLIQLEKDGAITYDRKNQQYEKTEVLLARLKKEQEDYENSIQNTTDKINALSQAESKSAVNAIDFQKSLQEMKKDSNGLAAALEKLTDQDFANFVDGLNTAIATGYVQGADVVEAKNAALQESFKRLNVDVQLFENGMTTAGNSAVIAFDYVASEVSKKADQIQEAFNGALEKVSTEEGINALRERLTKLGEEGKLSAEQVAEGMVKIEERTIAINSGLTAMSQVAVDEFDKLSHKANLTGSEITKGLGKAIEGIDSKRGLERVRETLNRLHRDGKIDLQQLKDYMGQVEEAAKGIGDAVEVATKKLDELSAAISGAESLNDLNDAAIQAGIAWQEGTITAQEYLDKMKEIDDAKKGIIDSTQQQIDKERELKDVVTDVGDQHDQTAGKAVKGHRRAARAANQAAAAMGVSTSALQKAKEEMNAYDSRWKEGKGMAFYKRYTKALDKLAKKYYDAERAQQKMADQDLTRGETARSLEEMKRKTDELTSAAKSAQSEYAGLQGELANLEGDQMRVQELQYQQRRADLIAKAADAEAAGNDKAASKYRQSLNLLAQINEIQRRNIEQKQREEKIDNKQTSKAAQVPAIAGQGQSIKSSQALITSGETVTVAFQSPDGRTVNGQFEKSEVGGLLSVIKQAGAVTK